MKVQTKPNINTVYILHSGGYNKNHIKKRNCIYTSIPVSSDDFIAPIT